MNNTKKINVNFSSLVGLKAELLRKQHEVNEAKLKSEVIHIGSKLPKKKSKKIKEKNETEDSQKTVYIEDADTHKKSKLMLEAKARLYERLKKSKTTNENFLVDFAEKSDESEEELAKDKETDALLENEDDWVEYEDCFGRTRKCLREDLSFMQEKDQLIKQQIISKKGIDPKTKDVIEQNYVEEEKEPEIEIMRRKWEEQTKKLIDKANIHYQDVLFDEARTHGVGYYAFSQDEEERIKQQENLFNLRKETERKQKEIQELKELREKMECNRLKAARIRQRVRAGLPIDNIEEGFEPRNEHESQENISKMQTEEDKSVGVKGEEDNKNQNMQKDIGSIENKDTEKDEKAEKETKIQALGALLGKRTQWYEMSQEEWVDKCRKVRITEFGPVYYNFKSAGYLNPQNAETVSSSQNNKKSASSKINIQNESTSEININSYDIPLPPSWTINDSITEHNRVQESNQNNLTQAVQHASNDAMQNQIATSRTIDEDSIAAGLRYLREKFEKGQNS